MNWQISSRLANRFTRVFEDNEWEDGETVSGPGSRKDSEAVRESIEALDIVIEHFDIKSISDIPCGDFNWFGKVLKRHTNVSYSGFDIVEPLINRNRSLHPDYEFYLFDITRNIPPVADLIFTKELFIHLKFQDIKDSIENMKNSHSTYILSLNHFDCENVELENDIDGSSRALNLRADPFNFPEPVWQHSYFGLWEIIQI